MVTKYQRVADDLLSKILSGTYGIGEAIPTENKLCELYSVSRHTVRQAIGLLVQKGYLRSEKGSGTFVLDYSASAKALNSSSKKIGVITTYISDYIFPNIIEGIEEVLREKGYSLLLCATQNDSKQEEVCLKQLIEQWVDGFLVEPTSSSQYNPNLAYYSQLTESGIPIYFLNAYYDLLDLPYTSVDDYQSGYLATEYLIQNGHNHTALITKLDDIQGKLRMKGFIKAHEVAKIPFNPADIVTFTTQNQTKVVLDFVRDVLQSDNPPSAVVCYNDQIASLLIRLAKEVGLDVPGDFSIVSHDDSFLAEAQGITSIKHPKNELGRAAALQLVNALEKADRMQTIIYPASLSERESVRSLL